MAEHAQWPLIYDDPGEVKPVEHTVTSTEAKNTLNRLLADIERTGVAVTITNHGRPVAKLVPVQPVARKFGQLPNLVVPKDFDDPLPDAELAAWEGADES